MLPESLQGLNMPLNFPASGAGPSMAPSTDNKAAMEAVIDALSVSKPEPAEPPEGSMLVPLLKHQKLALGWMLSREGARSSGKALCPDGGMLADDQVCSAAFICAAFLSGGSWLFSIVCHHSFSARGARF